MATIHEQINSTGTPLIDGETVTFVWQSETHPLLIGDFFGLNFANPAPQTEFSPGLWTYRRDFPRDAYIGPDQSQQE